MIKVSNSARKIKQKSVGQDGFRRLSRYFIFKRATPILNIRHIRPATFLLIFSKHSLV